MMNTDTYTKETKMLTALLVVTLFSVCIASTDAMANETPRSSDSVANTRNIPTHKYELRFSWNGFPVIDNFLSDPSFETNVGSDPNVGLDRMYRSRFLGKYTTAIISSELLINFNKKFSLGVSLGCNSFWDVYYDPIYNSSYKKTSLIFNIMAIAYGNWYQNEIFRVYSGAGLGFHLGFNLYSNIVFFPTLELIPVGLTVGKRLYGLIELSSGISWAGGRIGIGYKF